ncbi:acyl-CoA dehydrogenase family protein [Qipengyuania sp. XHP0211]|uniref:acyl-CoA dehydrogenase family protein n=1 Tax=Qipengyuania sp. XHP0211 TaxID=3038079 RepID=UPI00241ED3E2|nr:acyl-CoA dehydrogenase family protein [Qipengyuania sp. XHP0211]MDG5750259.1 acyl-CoA dehydrogenase family protein [Qipengyuania sp. XHP0211]
MDLKLDEQQELLKQSLDRYLEKTLPFDVRREQKAQGRFVAFWKRLEAELGVAAAGIAERSGGFGGGAESEMIISAALGRALAVTPYITCQVLSANLLDALGEHELAGRIAAGELLVTTAIEEPQTRGDVRHIRLRAERDGTTWRLTGTKLVVDFAAEADLVLLPARVDGEEFALFVVDPAILGNALKPFALIDDTPSADIVCQSFELAEDACLATGDAVLRALKAAVARALAAICAEASGIASVMVGDTVQYTKEREQFGVPISSFQALQHRMVDMWSKAQEIEAASLLAALKVDDPAAISAAKATVGDALRLIGQEAVQLHGAMGLTEELRVGHYFKRATVIENRLGTAADHVERYRKLRQAG